MSKVMASVLLVAAAAGASSQGRRGTPAAPSGDIGALFASDNYPPLAMRKREQGRVIAKLQIGADGKVRACAIDVSSGSQILDQTTCDIALKRMTFTPARNLRGRAVASTYTLPVRWVLPEEGAPQLRVSFEQEMRFDISPDDKLLSCREWYNGKAVSGNSLGCESWMARSPLELRAMKGDLAESHAIVAFRQSLRFEGSAAAASVPTHAGAKVMNLTRMTFDVQPDGTVANENVVEQLGFPMMGSGMVKALGAFMPADGKTDHGTFIGVVTVAAAP